MDAKKRRTVLMDSSSAIILFKSSMFELVSDYWDVVMPESVFDELTGKEHPGSSEFIKYRSENRIHIVSGDIGGKTGCADESVLGAMGPGERDTILQYHNKWSDMIIIDDGKGAAHCRKNNIPYINALLVPRILYLADRINGDERESMMKKITEYGRYSIKIIEFAYCCSDEIIERFL